MMTLIELEVENLVSQPHQRSFLVLNLRAIIFLLLSYDITCSCLNLVPRSLVDKGENWSSPICTRDSLSRMSQAMEERML